MINEEIKQFLMIYNSIGLYMGLVEERGFNYELPDDFSVQIKNISKNELGFIVEDHSDILNLVWSRGKII